MNTLKTLFDSKAVNPVGSQDLFAYGINGDFRRAKSDEPSDSDRREWYARRDQEEREGMTWEEMNQRAEYSAYVAGFWRAF